MDEEESRRNLPITDEAKAEVDEEIARENASAKTKGQQDAERNREAMQSEADKDASRVRSEVESDNKDMQHRIDNANNNINNGGTVNEQDFGSHDVDFDDEHSDSNGNLDNSVENITTDGSNDKTNDPLPDPNETGRKFDRAATGTSNEELVDQYIEYIAETSSYGDEDAYQYVK